ncbi:divalent-cation tolerance protein CutA [Amycolatopsis acidiphila]|uniref:Divalent-cation tolerance protein CutA n=1 Tax=Amycolatopsis acidiphila TaxID=715473 RepID=A0A558AMY1_9PSEU|nr:divalent-cation tolerance protein CutA [Amycolatopsis acidiphila]TVT25617.1 divalent-cation tolerance protein CutA [Amycolatopsis acidiphila]UIJ60372.1 divalent-cation tolerance protein CutA [Amycolatopsis acidiphila]GHG90497.1 divalent cation tolerance protein [Amycolatopsis acidiphila]
MPGHVIVTTTTDSAEAARDLAAQAVAAKLGACAQIVGPITSVYRWEGEVRTDAEWRVEIKTAADRVPPLVSLLKSVHSYDIPEIIATPIEGGSADYLDWLVSETRV